MIVFQNVTKKYGTADPVLAGINFNIDKGNFAYLVGPTVSGKSTIFRLIIRDVIRSVGSIAVGDFEVDKISKSKVPHLRRRVGVVFQDLKLLADRTVAENVMLPLDFAGMSEIEARRRAEEIINEVGLGDKKDNFPAQLSGGESQRVAIARALVFNPDLILADEPTGNLDIKTSFQILDLLKGINKKGTTVFMATHNDKLIGQEDRVIVLESGRIVEDRRPAQKSSTKEKKEEEKKEKSSEHEKKIDLESLAKK